MKNIFLLIILLVYMTAYSQNNVLSVEAFSQVSFNGVSLEDIGRTNADKDKLNTLFRREGKAEFNSTCPDLCVDYWNDDISIHFYDDNGNGQNFYISDIEVKTSKINVQIDSINVKIGDHYSVLGDGVRVSEPDQDRLTASFVPEDFPAWYIIEIEKETGVINRISYGQLP